MSLFLTKELLIPRIIRGLSHPHVTHVPWNPQILGVLLTTGKLYKNPHDQSAVTTARSLRLITGEHKNRLCHSDLSTGDLKKPY